MGRDIIREAVKGSCDELYRSVARVSRLALCVWMGEKVLHGEGGCVILKREGDDGEVVGL